MTRFNFRVPIPVDFKAGPSWGKLDKVTT
jgi:hypothetical protein